ncbi:major capsid protein [Capybara microvirus Cap1_SP_168]|nr:major capsid protein [Capybara microvirus Cap1_SP_168]
MSRNENYRFDLAPQAEIRRSTFKGLSHSLKTSFNVGDLIPILCEPIYPGDTFKISSSKIVRMQTLLVPLMDNVFMDVYYFFVPNRLIWEHFEQFAGGSIPEESPFLPVPDYQIPQITAPAGGFDIGSLADYLGYPTGVSCKATALPMRAYAKIYNDWFRDENLQNYYTMDYGDADILAIKDNVEEIDYFKYGYKPGKVNKYHDYFTSCLLAPQKGPDVLLPLAKGGEFPVTTSSFVNDAYMAGNFIDYDAINNAYPISYGTFTEASVPGERMYQGFVQVGESNQGNTNDIFFPSAQVGARWDQKIAKTDGNGYSFDIHTLETTAANHGKKLITPINLVAPVTDASFTINSLRQAFQIQRLLEKDSRGGTRYIEQLKVHFGVTSPDARLQRSEYLGGSRFPINIHQVTQTSSTDETSPLGETAALSVTKDIHDDINKSFVEHGLLIGLAAVRYEHTYQYGLPRWMSAQDRYDFYWPVFANLGEMSVKNKEIYCTGVSQIDDQVFGYQEAYADLRYSPSRVTGEMRSSAPLSLDVWHLADKYDELPHLSAEWIQEDKSNVDRVLAVQSDTSNQVFADIYFDIKATRAMPLYSVPGFIDHF